MAHEIRVPRLGWSMEVGTFLGWRKQDGERVVAGEPLFELEGEKAAQEIEAIDSGVLRIPPDAPEVGREMPVGALLGYLMDADEPLPWQSGPAAQPTPSVMPQPASSAAPSVVSPERPDRTPPTSPAVRHRARQLGVAIPDIVGSGRRGRVTRADLEAFVEAARMDAAVVSAANQPAAAPSPSSASARRVATPRARRIARELRVDWTSLTGSGRQGRVREADVRRAAAQTPIALPLGGADADRIPLSKRRRVIAQRMVASHQSTAPVTLTTRADAANLVNTREQFKGAAEIVPTYNDLITKLVGGVLKEQRQLAAYWDHEQLLLPALDQIHIGLAVDTDAGLLVPVLRNVTTMSLAELARTSLRLVERARAGQLTQTELQGAVFTVTNLGSYGIDAFTPMINLPESAILGVGAIRREPVVRDDDSLGVGWRLTLSLTFDHRVIDGAPAARFLASVRAAIESPVPHLLGH